MEGRGSCLRACNCLSLFFILSFIRAHFDFFLNSIAAMAIAPEPSIEVAIMFANSNVLSEVMPKEDAIKSEMTTIHNAKATRRETIAISFTGMNVMTDFIVDFMNVLTVLVPMIVKYRSIDI